MRSENIILLYLLVGFASGCGTRKERDAVHVSVGDIVTDLIFIGESSAVASCVERDPNLEPHVLFLDFDHEAASEHTISALSIEETDGQIATADLKSVQLYQSVEEFKKGRVAQTTLNPSARNKVVDRIGGLRMLSDGNWVLPKWIGHSLGQSDGSSPLFSVDTDSTVMQALDTFFKGLDDCDCYSVDVVQNGDEIQIAAVIESESGIRVVLDVIGRGQVEQSSVTIDSLARVRFSPNGIYLLILTDSQFQMIETATEKVILEKGFDVPSLGSPRSILFQQQLLHVSDNGKYAAAALPEEVALLDLRVGKVIDTLKGTATAVAVRSDGSILVGWFARSQVTLYRNAMSGSR